MAEYIKRTDLIDAAEELIKSPYANDNSENILLRQFSCGVKDALKLVRDMAKDEVPDSMKIPSADVRKSVRGKWIEDGFLDRKTCSVCGTWIADNTGTAKLNYCPNCGADNRCENNG